MLCGCSKSLQLNHLFLSGLTQVIIEKAYEGNKDHIRAALDLFVDFVAIFVSIFSLALAVSLACTLQNLTTACTAAQVG